MLLKVNFWKLCPNILLQAPSKVIIHYKKYFIMQLFFLAILDVGLWEGIKAPLKLLAVAGKIASKPELAETKFTEPM